MKSVKNITIPKNINDKLIKKESLSSNGALNLTKDVIPLSKFEGNSEKALQFYSTQVTKLNLENSILNNSLKIALK